jgi:hypothetical protein
MRTLLQKRHTLIAGPGDFAAESPEASPEVQPRERLALTKSGMAWVWVRLIGVAFLLKVFETTYDLVMQLGLISNIFTVASVVGAEPGPQTSRLWIGVVLMAGQILFYSLLTYYLLRRGKAVHRTLMFERGNRPAND